MKIFSRIHARRVADRLSLVDVGHKQRRHHQGKALKRARPVPRAVEGCFPFGYLSDKSFRTACALFKPLEIIVVVTTGAGDGAHEAFSVRPTPFGDCSEREQMQSTAMYTVCAESTAQRQGGFTWWCGKNRVCTIIFELGSGAISGQKERLVSHCRQHTQRGALRCVTRCKCNRLNVGTLSSFFICTCFAYNATGRRVVLSGGAKASPPAPPANLSS